MVTVVGIWTIPHTKILTKKKRYNKISPTLLHTLLNETAKFVHADFKETYVEINNDCWLNILQSSSLMSLCVPVINQIQTLS